MQENLVTRAQLDEAKRGAASQPSQGVAARLLEKGAIDHGDLARVISEKMSIPLADRKLFEQIPDAAIRAVARDLADEFSLIPVGVDKDGLKVAMLDPTDHATIEELSFFVGKRIKPMVASHEMIQGALKRYYRIERPPLPQAQPRASNSEAAAIPPVKPLEQVPARTPIHEDKTLIAPAVRHAAINEAPTLSTAIVTPPPATPATPTLSNAALDTACKEAVAKLSTVKSKEDLAAIFLGFACLVMRRVALFTIKKNVVLGWAGQGPDLEHKNLKGIMIPLNSPSIFQRVRDSKVYFFGEVEDTTVNQIFLTALGNIKPPNVILVPIVIGEKVACIFYGDHGDQAIPTENLHLLHLLVPAVQAAFERLILQMKKTS